MQIFKNRPLALALSVFAMASILSCRFSEKVKIWCFSFLLFLAIIGITVAICRKSFGKQITILVLCAFFASLSIFQSWFHFQFLTRTFREKADQRMVVEGYVIDVLDTNGSGSMFAVQLQEADGTRSDAKILLECTYRASLQRGDTFRLTGTVRLPQNTLSYAEETILFSDGYLGVLVCEDWRDCSVFEEKHFTLLMRMLNARDMLSERFKIALDRDHSAIASALFLGDRSDLSGDVILNFQRSGISHLLALSGMHISVVILMWEILLRKLKISKLYRAFIVPTIAVGYLLLTGCAPSTIRAVLMLCILYLAYLFSADYDPFAALCVALFLILTVTPFAVVDTSMWMSFIASAGILIFLPAVSVWLKKILQKRDFPRIVKQCVIGFVTAIAVGMFANAALLPFLTYFYGKTSVFSVGMTLVLSPVLSLALPLCALTLLLPWCVPLVKLTQWVLGVLLSAAKRVGNVANCLVLLTGELTVVLTVILTILLILFAVIRLRQKRWILLPLSLSFLILGVAATDAMPTDAGVSVLYLQNGDEEALVLAKGRTAVAFDMSAGSGATAWQIEDAVMQSKCTELQELVLTHYHTQTTRLISLLSSQIKIRALRLPEPNCEKEIAIAKRLEQEASVHGIEVIYGMEHFPIEQVELQILERTSENSKMEVPVMLSLTVGEMQLAYVGGNAWSGDTSALAENIAISADCLILGAHGMYTVPSNAFFERFQKDKNIIFGNELLFAAYPRHRRPLAYSVGEEYKQFYLK